MQWSKTHVVPQSRRRLFSKRGTYNDLIPSQETLNVGTQPNKLLDAPLPPCSLDRFVAGAVSILTYGNLITGASALMHERITIFRFKRTTED